MYYYIIGSNRKIVDIEMQSLGLLFAFPVFINEVVSYSVLMDRAIPIRLVVDNKMVKINRQLELSIIFEAHSIC